MYVLEAAMATNLALRSCHREVLPIETGVDDDVWALARLVGAIAVIAAVTLILDDASPRTMTLISQTENKG